ncbi:MAG: hypothetical protein WC588_03080 [Candidatus Micrarchaeia archaeon]
MRKEDIIRAIDARVMTAEKKDYAIWTVGITNDPKVRKPQHGTEEDVRYWQDWHADSEGDARAIEKYFLAKGMKGGAGGGNPDDKPDWVYIF